MQSPWPDWTSRLSACGRGGKVTAKPTARTCANGSHRRGESRRSRARTVPRGHAPRIDSPGTGREELENLDFFPHGCLAEVIVFDQ